MTHKKKKNSTVQVCTGTRYVLVLVYMWCGGGGGARVPGIPYTRVENLLKKN